MSALAETGNVTLAASAAGVNRATPYRWRQDDPDFARAWEDAMEAAADKLEQEAWRRAVEGVEEPVYRGGKLVGTVRKYSDTLLIFLLKGARPHKYQDRVVQQHVGAGGGPVEHKHTLDLRQLSVEELRQIEQILAKAQQGTNA